jgi:spore coat polysaccharide biosynthesis predicted glycosyltransferase SpsG
MSKKIIAFCVESSHARGMGHLFRSLNLAFYFRKKNVESFFFINNDDKSHKIITQNNFDFRIVNFPLNNLDFLKSLICEHSIMLWINDRFSTTLEHASSIKKCNIPLVTFDDIGSGSSYADIHIAALIEAPQKNHHIKNQKIYSGERYLILDKNISVFRRLRNKLSKIVIAMGGSDTHGTTLKIVRLLVEKKIPATIIMGPLFNDKKDLYSLVNNDYIIKDTVHSLVEEFYNYDLAFTGGGITAFEAASSGLPTCIIANEIFEIRNAIFLKEKGCSIFLGHHSSINANLITNKVDVLTMSQKCLEHSFDGTSIIASEILKLIA